MIHSISKLAPWGTLAVFALVACNDRQKGPEPAEYGATPAAEAPAEEAAPPPIQYPPGSTAAPQGNQQQWGQPGAPGAQSGAQWGQQGQGQQGQQGAAGTQDADLLVITITGVDIDTKLAQMCNLPGSSVFFKFDSTKLQADARDRLQQLATCLTTGPAKGKNLLLIGRTDPRGPDDYNKQLGMSRAEAVARHLRQMGITSARVETESMGEAGAARDPMAWPLERRVTIRLQQ